MQDDRRDDDLQNLRAGGVGAGRNRRAIFTGSPVDRRDGFIHFSTAAQVAETAAKHFAGLPDLILVAVDADMLGAQ